MDERLISVVGATILGAVCVFQTYALCKTREKLYRVAAKVIEENAANQAMVDRMKQKS